MFTADVDLTSTFGEVKTLTGVISTVDPDQSPGSIVLDGTDSNSADENGSVILEDGTETGDAVTAIGLENPANQADKLLGSGTKFLTELKFNNDWIFSYINWEISLLREIGFDLNLSSKARNIKSKEDN